jgi:hypothetical protein
MTNKIAVIVLLFVAPSGERPLSFSVSRTLPALTKLK